MPSSPTDHDRMMFLSDVREDVLSRARGAGAKAQHEHRGWLGEHAQSSLERAVERAAREGERLPEPVAEALAAVKVASEWPTMAYASSDDDAYIGYHPCPPLPDGPSGDAMAVYWWTMRQRVFVLIALGLLP